MPKYSVSVPFGKIEAKSFRTFVSRVQIEWEFWSRFDIGGYQEFDAGNGSQSWTGLQMSTWKEMQTFWPKLFAELDAMDGRSFPGEFERIKTRIEAASDVPPCSSAHLSGCISDWWGTSEHSGALALIWAYTSSRNPRFEKQIRYGHEQARYTAFAQSLFFSVIGQDRNASDRLENILNERSIAVKITEELGLALEAAGTELDAKRSSAETFQKSLARRIKRLHSEFLHKSKLAQEAEASAFNEREKVEAANREKREAEFEAMKNAYEAQLRLQHPAKMWSERQANHEGNSNAAWNMFKWGAVAFLVLSAVFVFFFGDWVADSFIKKGCEGNDVPSCRGISPKGPLVVATTLTVLTLGLWYLRLQMKLFLSERHLALDARERSAFAETYLSLVKKNAISSDQEVVVLQSLFRPTQDGIIQDDNGPDFAVAGLLARALEKK